MWTRKVIALVAATLAAGALAACGSSEDKVDSAEPKKAGTDKLEGALLTIKDLPAGFEADDQAGTAKHGSSACGKALDAFGLPASAGKGGSPSAAQVAARFAKGDLGPHIEQVVQQLPEKDAAANLGRTRDALAKCTKWEDRTDAGVVTKSSLTMAHSGAKNDVVSARLLQTTDEETVVTDFVALRIGGVVCVLRASAAKTLDGKLVIDVTKKAAERLRDTA
jgi:hypothetical protein